MPVTIAKPFRIQTQTAKPKMYLLSIYDEKHASWEFCIRVLMEVFHKDFEKAKEIAEVIVNDGEAICGLYMLEIAETKAIEVENLEKNAGFSLLCLIEEV